MRTNNKPTDGNGTFHGGTQRANEPMGKTCNKCGAVRADKQIGLEPTPEAYVAVMVEVFREVRRVLRRDGTLWLNLGDSYAGYHGSKGTDIPASATNGWTNGTNENARTSTANRNGLKQKDLIGIPWRVAFALQADGWYLRQDIIWAKPNPMPESVTDRCTKAHEYLFLLSRSPRYHYDAEAIAEAAAYPDDGVRVATPKNAALGLIATTPYGEPSNNGTRNRRSVWTVATQPFKEAHFATFPPDLIEPCILAGCPKGGVVLDPFGGAGTTGLVADRLQRSAILIELNPAYLELAASRIEDDAPLFVSLEKR